MFSKILIANRGEIAVRIIRACKEMGIATVAVFSEADREAMHVSLADESYCIGGALSKNSYLNMRAVVSAAMAAKAEAIHPGYGFLSENAEFAALCREHGIVFIGPEPEVISTMGDKDAARKTMRDIGVPVIPGCDVVKDIAEAKAQAEKIGFPLLIKARSGGGGKGMRLVEAKEEFDQKYSLAVAEATGAFGDGAVYMEKFLSPVKHVEIQILADNFGNVVCLGDRDCSMQRNNQKVLEESPAALISDETRKRMIETSVKAAKAIGYKGAGTIEYLYKDGDFYFMEMNTRLQVEHAVTEMITLIDIVKWQIRIAAGNKLTFGQEDVTLHGCAIECRINAENPYQNFRPSSGTIELLHIPGGPGVRFDSAVYQGYAVPPFYDSMIGKLVVFAKTRDEAVRKMKAALCELIIEGIQNNCEFQAELLSANEFEDSTYTTGFIRGLLEGKNNLQ